MLRAPALLPIRLPADTSRKAVQYAEELGTVHSSGRPRRSPGSGLQSGPALANVALWLVNQQTKVSLSHFQINAKFQKRKIVYLLLRRFYYHWDN